jgi:hypothetical protein
MPHNQSRPCTPDCASVCVWFSRLPIERQVELRFLQGPPSPLFQNRTEHPRGYVSAAWDPYQKVYRVNRITPAPTTVNIRGDANNPWIFGLDPRHDPGDQLGLHLLAPPDTYPRTFKELATAAQAWTVIKPALNLEAVAEVLMSYRIRSRAPGPLEDSEELGLYASEIGFDNEQILELRRLIRQKSLKVSA